MLPSLPIPVVSIAHSIPKIKRVKKVYAGEGWIGEGERETETEAETDSAWRVLVSAKVFNWICSMPVSMSHSGYKLCCSKNVKISVTYHSLMFSAGLGHPPGQSSSVCWLSIPACFNQSEAPISAFHSHPAGEESPGEPSSSNQMRLPGSGTHKWLHLTGTPHLATPYFKGAQVCDPPTCSKSEGGQIFIKGNNAISSSN